MADFINEPEPFTSPRPQLMQRAVQDVLPILRENLLWLTHVYGLVQTVSLGKTKQPVLYRQDGTLFHKAILPNEKTMSALCFFERNGVSTIRWDQGAQQLMGWWQHPVNVLVWCNLPRIDRRFYDFSDELAADFLRVLREAGIPFEQLETRIERVFDRYALEEKKLLLYPFAGFKIPLILEQRYDACAQPFAQQDTDIEYLVPDLNTDDFLTI